MDDGCFLFALPMEEVVKLIRKKAWIFAERPEKKEMK